MAARDPEPHRVRQWLKSEDPDLLCSAVWNNDRSYQARWTQMPVCFTRTRRMLLRCSSLVALLPVCLTACAREEEGEEAPRTPVCAAVDSGPSYLLEPSLTTADISGDGADDVVTISAADGGYRLEAGVGGPVFEVDYFVKVGTVDLDSDGQGDLVIAEPWFNRVQIWRGPVRAGAQPMLRIEEPVDAGFAPWIGHGVLVGDVDVDGHADVVVTAPAETEEACLGTRQTRVFRGPFAAGAVLGTADIDILLGDVDARDCLGEEISCRPDGFRLSVYREGNIEVPEGSCFTVPLTSLDPVDCP